MSTSTEKPRSRRGQKQMSLGRHLLELQRRLMIAAAALIVGMVIAYLITEPVIHLMTEPIRIIAERRGDNLAQLNFETITSAFDLRMRIAFAIGIIISAPVWLWQLWAFVMPGLTRKEILYTVGFLGTAIPLFFGGAFVGWLTMPHIIEVMASFVPEQGAQFYTASYYYDFIFKLVLIVGVSFVLPIFLVALNIAGVLSGKAILKGWRVAVLGATIFAAIATPAADVMSMVMLGGILVILYVAAAGVSLLFDRRRRKREAAFLAAGPDV